MQVESIAGETLTDLIFRIFNTLPQGYFESTLAKNSHLLGLPLRLPSNTLVELDLVKNQIQEVKTINLWD